MKRNIARFVPRMKNAFDAARDVMTPAVAVDGSGNTLLTGYFESTIDFGTGPIPVMGSRNAYVAQLDSAGAALWSKGYGTSAVGRCIDADGLGRVYAAGYFTGTIDFGSGPHQGVGADDVFLVQLATLP